MPLKILCFIIFKENYYLLGRSSDLIFHFGYLLNLWEFLLLLKMSNLYFVKIKWHNFVSKFYQEDRHWKQLNYFNFLIQESFLIEKEIT